MHWFNTRTDTHGVARSEFAELPMLPEQSDDPDLRHWFVLTGGLALLLSRTPSALIRSHFPASHALHRALRRRAQRRDAEVTLDLLDEVRHEIATVADPLTKASLQACFRGCERHARRSAAEARAAAAETDWMASAPAGRSSWSGERHGEEMQTQIDPGLLAQRSSALREKVAAARSSAFADLK